jgi:transcriptional regulator with XRE-family HTH domain
MTDESYSGPLDPHARVVIGKLIGDGRRRAGLTGKQLADRTGTSQSRISRVESGRAPVTIAELKTLIAALDLLPDDADQILAVAGDRARPHDERPDVGGIPGRQNEILRIESTAREMRMFTPAAVPGLLQTSEYARGGLSRLHRLLDETDARPHDDVVLQSVATRMGRQGVLADPERRFHIVMQDTALSSATSTPAQMLAQIQRIRDVLKERDNVTVAIAPSDSYWSPAGPAFTVYDSSHVLIDLPHASLVLTDTAEVAVYRRLFDRLEESSTTDIDPILDRYLELYHGLARPHRD